MFVARGPQTIFTTLTLNIWHDFPVNCDRESSLGIVCVRCTTRSWCVIDSLCLLSSHISSFIDDDWPGYYIPEGEVFTQRAARWSRCWRSIFHFYRKWIWHWTGLEIRNWNLKCLPCPSWGRFEFCIPHRANQLPRLPSRFSYGFFVWRVAYQELHS